MKIIPWRTRPPRRWRIDIGAGTPPPTTIPDHMCHRGDVHVATCARGKSSNMGKGNAEMVNGIPVALCSWQRCARARDQPPRIASSKIQWRSFLVLQFCSFTLFWEIIYVDISALLNGDDKISIRCGRSSVQFYLEMISFSLALPYWVGLLLCSFGNQLIANALIPAPGVSAIGEKPRACCISRAVMIIINDLVHKSLKF